MENAEKTDKFFDLARLLSTHLPPHFEREKGSLGPRAVFLSVMRMSVLGTQSYGSVLDAMRKHLGEELGWESGVPSCSAFSQARRKLTARACVATFLTIRRELTRARAVPRETFHGLRLVAVDGTRLTLPPSAELVTSFGCPRNQYAHAAACPQAGLVVLWDISSNQPRAWELGPYTLPERTAAEGLLMHVGAGDLLLADRGYPGLSFFQAVQSRGSDYVIRMNTTTVAKTAEFVAFLASTATDQVVEFPSLVRGERRFPGDLPLRVRFVADPTDRLRVIATSLLDAKRYPPAEILRIYRSRWNIETAFREAKQWHGLEQFHARYAEGIHQEVAGIMTFQYLVSELEADVRERLNQEICDGTWPPEVTNDIPYTFNRRRIACMSNWLLLLAATQPHKVAAEWDYCVRELWRGRAKRRPGRSTPRIAKNPRSVSRATRPLRSTS
ncbi:MAG: IS4 family transposase [Pseudoxanthomonas sp.]